MKCITKGSTDQLGHTSMKTRALLSSIWHTSLRIWTYFSGQQIVSKHIISHSTALKVPYPLFSWIRVSNAENTQTLHIFCYICSLCTSRGLYFTLTDSFKEYSSFQKSLSEATAEHVPSVCPARYMATGCSWSTWHASHAITASQQSTQK